MHFFRRNVDYEAVFGKRIWSRLGKMLWGLVRRKKLSDLIRKHTRLQNVLRMIVLPFEDKACIESARLVECPASFAYEHPKTGRIRLMPVCAWVVYKDGVLRQTAEKYGTTGAATKEGAADLNVQPIGS